VQIFGAQTLLTVADRRLDGGELEQTIHVADEVSPLLLQKITEHGREVIDIEIRDSGALSETSRREIALFGGLQAAQSGL
jgi:hypothetical protein